MQIVEGKPEHAREILEIRRQVRVDTYVDYAEGVTSDYIDERNKITPERIEEEALKLGDNHYNYQLAEDNGLLVAYQKAEGLPRQSINFLHVLASHRNRGIGSQLLDLAFEWFQPGDIFVEVTKGNEGAKRLYERLGFQATGQTLESLPIPGGGFLYEEVMSLTVY